MTPSALKFDTLYRQLAPAVKRVAASFLHDPADQEEACQASWLKVFQAIEAGTRIGNAKPWIHEIAKNECLMLLRSRKADPTAESIEDMVENGTEPAEDPYEEPSIDPRLKAALRAAVDTLPDKTREVVNRFYFANQGVPVIAREMGIGQSTVTSHLSRGRDALRALFTRGSERNAA